MCNEVNADSAFCFPLFLLRRGFTLSRTLRFFFLYVNKKVAHKCKKHSLQCPQ